MAIECLELWSYLHIFVVEIKWDCIVLQGKFAFAFDVIGPNVFVF
jgi:hypothetical protein